MLELLRIKGWHHRIRIKSVERIVITLSNRLAFRQLKQMVVITSIIPRVANTLLIRPVNRNRGIQIS